MDWTRPVDGYCERLDPSFWAEPVNALTNLAFLLAAVLMWRRSFGLGRALAAVLFVIGAGSFLFHTVAQPWAGLADTLPILAFVLVYIFSANRDFWHLRTGPALGVTLLFLPFAAMTTPVFRMIPGIGGSAMYMPVPLLIVLYALLLARRAPDTARGLAIGAGILLVSLLARILDEPLCANWPTGTHFVWHLLNATMLAWMIRVWTRHRLAGNGRGR